MGPNGVGQENVVQANQLSDEDYVIYRTKNSNKNDEDSTAKAWMITAKTLFPRNFAVQLEAYATQKASNNPKEAARHFSSLFFDFPHENELWLEAEEITEALQSDGVNASSQFHRDLFSHMLVEVQHQLLLAMADRVVDTLEHCRLMLILITKLPQFIDNLGKKLIDTLLTAEKHSHYQNPVNCFRKLLIVDLLPLLFSSKTLDIPQKQIYRLILKSIEFYLSWLAIGFTSIPNLEESTTVGAEEAWRCLFKLITASGKRLGWEMSQLFNYESWNRDVVCQSLWAFYRTPSLGNDENMNFRQLLYCTTVLFLESVFEYVNKLDPLCFQPQSDGNKVEGLSSSFLLVRAFAPNPIVYVHNSGESLSKRRKDEHITDQSLPVTVTVTKTCAAPTATTLMSSFLTAVSCWQLLHQTEELRSEFSKICLQLRTDAWQWLPSFVADGLLYQGLYAKALTKLQSIGPNANQLGLSLKSAGILFCLGNYVAAAEQVLQALSFLPEGIDNPPQYPLAPSVYDAQLKIGVEPSLHFMAMTRHEILQNCVNVLLACLREQALRNGNSDMALGHLIVLLQFDWPSNALLFEEVTEKIRRQGQFVYPFFVTYVLCPDILEEFAFLAADQGGAVNMDIFPASSTQLATQRRMTTRRGDLGAREEFRISLKRQMTRSPEYSNDFVLRFIMQEKDVLLETLKN